jgi:DNA topoisomerase-3
LYDLTSLQKDCNVHLDLSAEKTLEIAQSLYEKKMISYPRTSSRYIPEDVFREIPSLLRMALRMDRFKHFADEIDTLRPAKRSVDDKKITDHHALIITGNYPDTLEKTESEVYRMIAGRMLEAFAPRCEKEALLMEASFDEYVFRSNSLKILSPGWRNVFSRTEDKEEEEKDVDAGLAEFKEGENVKVGGHGLAQKKTMPKPLYTEATLLSAMETAGKNIADEASREAMKEQGLGTPATRASIIETLFKREYIERSGKSLIPTEKGLFIYDAVKYMRIADVELTGNWEKTFAGMERNEVSPETFMKAIEIHTRQITEEVLSLTFPQISSGVACPKCGTGKVIVRHKLAKCDNDKCGLLIFRKFLNKELTDQYVQQLLSSGETKLIKGFKGKKGNTFDAKLVFDPDYNITFSFPKTAGKGKKNTSSKPPTNTGRKKK